MSMEATIILTPIFGRVELSSWLEPQSDGSLKGMGRCVRYDGNGNVTSDETEPTGLVLRWG